MLSMRPAPRRRFETLLLGLFLVLGTAVAASAQNQATGTFTVKGQKTSFAYAYAYWKESPFGNQLMVLLSDVAIPPGTIPKDDDGVAKMAELVRANKVHAIELHLSPSDKKLDAGENAAVFHVGLSPGRHGMSGMHVFAAKTFTSSLVEGTSHTDGTHTSDGVTWSYEATFKVALPPAPR